VGVRFEPKVLTKPTVAPGAGPWHPTPARTGCARLSDMQAPTVERDATTTPRQPTATEAVAAAAAAGAGLVHAAAAGSHGGDTTVMWLFACTAAAQLAWAAAMALRPGRATALAGVGLNGAAVLAWVASRTVGLTGPLAGVEPVGTQDLLAAILGGVALGAAALALRPRRHENHTGAAHRAVVGLAVGVVVLLAVPGMAAEHSHGSGDDHAHAAGTAAAHDHAGAGSSTTGTHDHAATSSGAGAGAPKAVNVAATTPIVTVDDPRLSPAQRNRARGLLVASRTALTRFPDEAAIVAAGYRSIGDGRGVGGFEHFVHAGYLRDGRELDPSAIESIVMQRQADGTKRVASAMYILEPGKTMANVPEIAGALTTWHDHQNLCWNDNGRLAGLLVNGVCVPGGTFRPTPPMLHVWVDNPACGPFTGIEGHGGGDCAHSH